MVEPGRTVPSDAEFVVVGAGLLGLCTAWHLVRRGCEVVVLERDRVGHPRAGSHGSCRIFRLGYDDPRYVEMAKQARPLWRQMEAATGSELLMETGQVTFGEDLPLLISALTEAGAPFERWPAADVARRFPEVAAPGPAVFEPASGVIDADRCLRTLRAAVQSCLHEGVAVLGLADEGRTVRVKTTAGDISASGAVCCAGPWSAPLLATAGIGLALTVSVEQVAYFASRRPLPTAMPVIVERNHPMMYGLSTPDLACYKLGLHHSGRPVHPDGADMVPDPAADRPLVASVARLLPGFDPHPVRSERCFYDNTPDQDFVIDRVGRIVIGAGTSGHGFKFGPLVGEILADLARGQTPRLPVDWLAATRPGLRATFP
ncbi:MAG TPA: FAD-dependent oxidoreductase [Acidimicrobiales bacterium]|nr:FAD-dependent oxidoreductase [Acidimicrobiales bacterium]